MKKPAKKKAEKRVRQNWAQMVIRVSVPLVDIPGMKINHVRGIDKKGWLCELEILNAYYDIPGHPDAMPS